VIDKSHLDNKNKTKKQGFLDKRLGVSNQQNQYKVKRSKLACSPATAPKKLVDG
jgi:hypothetical protein